MAISMDEAFGGSIAMGHTAGGVGAGTDWRKPGKKGAAIGRAGWWWRSRGTLTDPKRRRVRY